MGKVECTSANSPSNYFGRNPSVTFAVGGATQDGIGGCQGRRDVRISLRGRQGCARAEPVGTAQAHVGVHGRAGGSR